MYKGTGHLQSRYETTFKQTPPVIMLMQVLQVRPSVNLKYPDFVLFVFIYCNLRGKTGIKSIFVCI